MTSDSIYLELYIQSRINYLRSIDVDGFHETTKKNMEERIKARVWELMELRRVIKDSNTIKRQIEWFKSKTGTKVISDV